MKYGIQEYIQYIKDYNMKIFIYKFLVACLFIFILFHITFGYVVRSYEVKLQNSFSKDKIKFIKDKVRLEIQNGLKKDRIISKEDSILINKFLEKISKDLNDTK